jgi:hypothetical protein
MQKWTAFLFAALAVAAVAVIIGERPERGGSGVPTADGGADASVSMPSTGALADAGHLGQVDARHVDSGAPGELGEPGSTPSPEEGLPLPESPFGGSDAGVTLLNGAVPPALQGDAPKSVVFGVILVQYKGAQGAPGVTRTRDAALELAKQIAAEAKTDFKAALAKGDKLSLENAGRIPRGVLEPAPEYVLFSLPKDGVSDPVDTPRGFWIVHRIE